jgi:hypothetical protein
MQYRRLLWVICRHSCRLQQRIAGKFLLTATAAKKLYPQRWKTPKSCIGVMPQPRQ